MSARTTATRLRSSPRCPHGCRDRSLPTPGLLAHVLVSKYCDHLPLYRQEKIYARRHGVNLPRQTLSRWVELAADQAVPGPNMG